MGRSPSRLGSSRNGCHTGNLYSAVQGATAVNWQVMLVSSVTRLLSFLSSSIFFPPIFSSFSVAVTFLHLCTPWVLLLTGERQKHTKRVKGGWALCIAVGENYLYSQRDMKSWQTKAHLKQSSDQKRRGAVIQQYENKVAMGTWKCQKKCALKKSDQL